MIILLVEIAMLVYGMIAVITARFPGRTNYAAGGVGIRIAGVIMAMPLPVSIVTELALTAGPNAPRDSVGFIERLMALFFIQLGIILVCFVASIIVAALFDNPFADADAKKREKAWARRTAKRRRREDRDDDWDDDRLPRRDTDDHPPLRDPDDRLATRPFDPAGAAGAAHTREEGQPRRRAPGRDADDARKDGRRTDRDGIHPGVIFGLVGGAIGLVLIIAVIIVIASSSGQPASQPRAEAPPTDNPPPRQTPIADLRPKQPPPQGNRPPAKVPVARDPQVKNRRHIEGWGDITDPDGDCEIRGNKDKVIISVPGSSHDLSPRKKNAPRVLQQIDGDFAIQVKVTGDFDPGKTPAFAAAIAFNGAGLLVWENENNYLRLERNIWYRPNGQALQFPPLLEYWKNSKAAFSLRATAEPFFKGRSTYLKLERHGNEVQAFVSHDGAQWLAQTPIATQFGNKIQVGIAASNTSSQPFTVGFEELRISGGR